MFDANTGLLRTFTVDHLVLTMALSPDGKTLATGGGVISDREGMVKFWNLSSGSETAAYRPPMPGVISLVFSPDGRALALGSKSGMIQLWDVVGRRMRSDLRGHSKEVSGLAFSPDGATLASAGGDENGTPLERVRRTGTGSAVRAHAECQLRRLLSRRRDAGLGDRLLR